MARPADEHGFERGYNGWTNYATWNIHLWLTNDPQVDQTIRARAQQAPSDYAAGQAVRAYIEEQNPLADDASLYADLLGSALGSVNWDELARAFRDA